LAEPARTTSVGKGAMGDRSAVDGFAPTGLRVARLRSLAALSSVAPFRVDRGHARPRSRCHRRFGRPRHHALVPGRLEIVDPRCVGGSPSVAADLLRRATGAFQPGREDERDRSGPAHGCPSSFPSRSVLHPSLREQDVCQAKARKRATTQRSPAGVIRLVQTIGARKATPARDGVALRPQSERSRLARASGEALCRVACRSGGFESGRPRPPASRVRK
jgi:hypothetical protein